MDAPVLERLRPKLLIQLEPRAQGLEAGGTRKVGRW